MTMSVGFQPIISNETCGICLDSLGTAEAVAHTGNDGPKHPWHKDCIKGWIITSGTSRCPSCLVPMDKESLLTVEEEAARVLKVWKQHCMSFMREGGCLCLFMASASVITGLVATEARALEIPVLSSLIAWTVAPILGLAGGAGTMVVIGALPFEEIERFLPQF